ncbi:hypothetical protein EXN66_Car007376 [Channa argus]|uniref:Uncharacterized protein n=1 Tax=Channa argus TaxID=215402 RepID=A0A6G1PMZ2_CHAAH|nr:hypothetical protein EXN66_Car007376 [Channa argus]
MGIFSRHSMVETFMFTLDHRDDGQAKNHPTRNRTKSLFFTACECSPPPPGHNICLKVQPTLSHSAPWYSVLELKHLMISTVLDHNFQNL